MKKEIKADYSKQEKAYTIRYLLHGDKATMQFVVRCPTPDWHYYLAMDVGYHADAPQYEEQSSSNCCYRSSGKCFYDGSGLAADELWRNFQASGGDEEYIWNYLQERYDNKFKHPIYSSL